MSLPGFTIRTLRTNIWTSLVLLQSHVLVPQRFLQALGPMSIAVLSQSKILSGTETISTQREVKKIHVVTGTETTINRYPGLIKYSTRHRTIVC